MQHLIFFIVVIFSYFDSQENMLRVTATMVVSNTLTTILSLYLGFPFSSYGFCMTMSFPFLLPPFFLLGF